MKRSLECQGQILVPLSERAAAPISTPTDEESFKNISQKTVTKVMCLMIESLFREIQTSDKLYLAFSAVKDKIEKMEDKKEAEIVFNALVMIADTIHKRDPMRDFFG
jgi:hypothetical protein